MRAWPPMLARPAQAEPAGAAEVEREARVELTIVEGHAVERRLAVAAPMCLQPGRAPRRERRCRPGPGRTRAAWRCRRRAGGRPVRAAPRRAPPSGKRSPGARGGSGAVPRALRHSRWRRRRGASPATPGATRSPAKATAAARSSASRPAPGRRLRGRVVQRQPHAFQRDQAVGQLVLHGLEAADRLAELLAFLRVVDRHLEGAPRRAMGACQQAQAAQPLQVCQQAGRNR